MPRRRVQPSDLTLRLEHYLLRYPTSDARARQYLKRLCRQHDLQDAATAVEDALARARTLGLLDDTALTRGIVGSGAGRGDSRLRLKARLLARSLPAGSKALANHDEWAALQRFAQRRRLAARLLAAPDAASRQKIIAKLLRAGFPPDLVQRWRASVSHSDP